MISYGSCYSIINSGATSLLSITQDAGIVILSCRP